MPYTTTSKNNFFVWGLTQQQQTKIANKGGLDTAQQILEFLHTKQQTDAKANKATVPTPPLPEPAGGIANILSDDISINGNGNNKQRGGAKQQFRNRGGYRNHGYETGGAGYFTPWHFSSGSGSGSGNGNSGEGNWNLVSTVTKTIMTKKSALSKSRTRHPV